MLKPSLLKTPVTLIFFNRPEMLQMVFDQVKKACPEQLFLVQDGPRTDHQLDLELIKCCRDVVSQIDWECDVRTDYSEINLGCGCRPASGISWALSMVDRTIILEDDCVPDQTFFAYCEELLERYKGDERIAMISGLNHFQYWDTPDDYIFTRTGAIGGWATWRRSWEQYDYELKQWETPGLIPRLTSAIHNPVVARQRIKIWQSTFDSIKIGKKISYWDHQWGLVRFLQSQYVIVPKHNLITNIGVGVNSTHSLTDTANKFTRGENFFFIPAQPMPSPLKHPSFVMCDWSYDEAFFRIAYPTSIQKYINIIKGKMRKLINRIESLS